MIKLNKYCWDLLSVTIIGYLVEGIHGVLDPLGDDAGLVRLDADLDCVVDDALDAHHDAKSAGHLERSLDGLEAEVEAGEQQ